MSHRSLRAQPHAAHGGRIRITEQGEVIALKYSNPVIAQRNLDAAKARAEFLQSDYLAKQGDFLNQPDNARRLFDPNWGGDSSAESAGIRAQLLDEFIDRLQRRERRRFVYVRGRHRVLRSRRVRRGLQLPAVWSRPHVHGERRVRGDRWRSTICDDVGCCPPEGNPMPSAEDSHVAAEQIAQGNLMPFESVDDLRASIARTLCTLCHRIECGGDWAAVMLVNFVTDQ